MVNWYVWIRVTFVSLSGFLYGYDVGALSGVTDMKGYRQTINLSYYADEGNGSDSCDSKDDLETGAILGLIVALFSVGCFVGTLAGGVTSDLLGRKASVIIGAIVVSCGGILHTGAVNLAMVVISRLVAGSGVGILYQVLPLYVAEISPEKSRGRLLSVANIYGTVSFMVGAVLNLIVKNFLFGWRISVSVQFLAAAVLALGTFLLPRSPRLLVKWHKEEEAVKILTKVYGDETQARRQVLEIKGVLSTSKEGVLQKLKFVLQWRNFQRLLLGFFLLLGGRFTGSNFVTYFSVTLYCGIGLPGFAVVVAGSLFSIAGMVASLFIIDKIGRKPLYLVTIGVMCVSHVVSACIIFGFDLENTEDGTFSTSQKVAGYFVLISICLFLMCTVVSVGSLSWVIMGEIFPLRAKGFMMSIAGSGFWLGSVGVTQLGAVLITSPLNIAGTLLLFAFICFLLFLYILLLVPETKGLTLESVDEVFSRPWLQKSNVLFYLRCGCFVELLTRRRRRPKLEVAASEEELSFSSSNSSLLEEDSQQLIAMDSNKFGSQETLEDNL